LQGVDQQRLQLDVELGMAHRDTLRAVEGLAEKLRRVFQRAAEFPPPEDPELALYAGFLPDADKRLLAQVRATPAAELGTRAFPFRDPRYPELLFRYRARNWPQTLDADERARWEAFRKTRLTRHTPLTGLTLDDYFARLAELRHDPQARDKLPLLDQLQAWGEQLADSLDDT
jgi:exodeoxyribonuclease-1